MADDERPAVGTVAEEAARLLDALGGWATSAQAGYAARPAPGSPGARDAADTGPAGGADPTDQDGGTSGRRGPASSSSERVGSADPGCPTCGAQDGVGQAVTCQLCPVCQGIALLRSVRPETVDRLADLAGALAATLREVAGQRRGSGAADGPPSHSARPHEHADHPRAARPRHTQGHPSSPHPRVHDIVVDDGDASGSVSS